MNPGRAVPIEQVRWRDLTTVEGTVRSVRSRPWVAGTASTECTVLDDTGGIELIFLGRRTMPGIWLGTRIRAAGRVGSHHQRLAMLNPVYELLVD